MPLAAAERHRLPPDRLGMGARRPTADTGPPNGNVLSTGALAGLIIGFVALLAAVTALTGECPNSGPCGVRVRGMTMQTSIARVELERLVPGTVCWGRSGSRRVPVTAAFLAGRCYLAETARLTAAVHQAHWLCRRGPPLSYVRPGRLGTDVDWLP